MRSRVRAALVLVLTIGLLAFFFNDVKLYDVWTKTRAADARMLALAVGVTMMTYALRAFRWQYLLAPIGPTHFGTAFRTTVIGFAASFLLPARPGEVLRPYLLARREGLPPTAAFATIILERLLDLVTVLLLFGAFVMLVDPQTLTADPALYARVKTGGVIAGAGSIAGLAIFFVLAGHPERLGAWALRIEAVLPARLARLVAQFVEGFAQGLAVMRRPAHLAGSLLLSFPLWLSIALGIWVTSHALHMTFSYLSSFLVMTLLVVGVAMPTPGQVGGFHEMYKLSVMTFMGVPNDAAVAGAIVLHAVSFVPVTLLGLVFMAREGLSFGTMREIAATQEKATHSPESAPLGAGEGLREPPRTAGSASQHGGAVVRPNRAE
ncbi:MAG TPA: lysylphosphatidylglycerol synthase transmembrane domain-containing protein [Vicinamibacterales bacterium]